jgi:hypothetical protein
MGKSAVEEAWEYASLNGAEAQRFNGARVKRRLQDCKTARQNRKYENHQNTYSKQGRDSDPDHEDSATDEDQHCCYKNSS